jgi:hypothetical protein
MRILYAFIDISGNYDFSSSGTKYLVFTSLICTDVVLGIDQLCLCKHSLIEGGVDIAYFHASEDKQITRDKVFGIIARLNHLRVDSVIIEKGKTHPSLQELKKFYPLMIEKLLQYPFDCRGVNINQYDKVCLFLDRESCSKKELGYIKQAIKGYLSNRPGGTLFRLCIHPSATHCHLQLVDYCCWAIFRKWERSDERSYKKIQNLIKSEFPIFRFGTKLWY